MSCILDPDPTRQVISMQMCGNGIVEAGEECDPGLGNNSTCCDPQTCKLTVGATCDPSSSTCCTSDCRLAPATQLCRKSKDDKCDVPEFCTGNSSACPTDITKPNGKGPLALPSRWFSTSLRPKLWEWGSCVRQRRLHFIEPWASFNLCV